LYIKVSCLKKSGIKVYTGAVVLGGNFLSLLHEFSADSLLAKIRVGNEIVDM